MSQPSSNPECLLLVRSTLEMAALMKGLYPTLAATIDQIEAEVQRGGQMLLDAGSIPRARAALETIHRARLQLQQLGQSQDRLAA